VNPYPDELPSVLVAIGAAGVELAPHPTDAARLRHRPADLPPDLSERLRLHRAAVLGLLVAGYAPTEAESACVYSERLGVADELGMPTHPGSAAWLVAVGESMLSSCCVATHKLELRHGETDKRDSSGDPGERSDALRDRQGCGRGP
jgi:hypothetical protein